MDFNAARQLVQRQLTKLYAGWAENPKVLAYGFDAGTSWAPMIDWDGVLGVYVYLVDKRTGELTGLSFPEFADMPRPYPIGPWPRL